jgi:hypothetical protein
MQLSSINGILDETYYRSYCCHANPWQGRSQNATRLSYVHSFKISSCKLLKFFSGPPTNASKLTSCIQRHAPIPRIITDWSNEIEFESPEQAAATSLVNLASRYCDLRSSMGSFHDYTDPERIILTACAIDSDYDLWAKTCPIPMIYQNLTMRERSEEVFSDHYHVYPNLWVATVWNNYRAVRLLINELILDQLCQLYLNSPESPLLCNDTCLFENQVLASNATLLQLCHDICASVPFYLGFDPNAEEHIPRAIPKAVSGNLLLWPLYTAGCTDLVSVMMREWVAGRLQWISDVIGIRQAAPLAFSLRRKQDILTWQNEQEDDDVGSPIPSVELPGMQTMT